MRSVLVMLLAFGSFGCSLEEGGRNAGGSQVGSGAPLGNGQQPVTDGTLTVNSLSYSFLVHGGTTTVMGAGLDSLLEVSIGGVAQEFRQAPEGAAGGTLVVGPVKDETPIREHNMVLRNRAGNQVSVPVVVVNMRIEELESEPGNTGQYVDLQSDVPGARMTGYSLAFFDGQTGLAHVDAHSFLDAVPTDAGGRLRLDSDGSTNALQQLPEPFDGTLDSVLRRPGTAAVAFYQGTSIRRGDTPTETGLIDALVYGLEPPQGMPSFTSVLLKSGPVIYENANGQATALSIQRCGSLRRDSSQFQLLTPTPNQTNSCARAAR